MSGRRGTAVVAVVLVLTVAGAPLARTARAAAGCRSCPPGCPMHKPGKLKCHEAPGSGTTKHHGCGPQGSGLAAPGCDAGREVRGVALPPAVLPPPVVSWPAPAGSPHRLRDAWVVVRGADPPETPPPIARS
jgi:hypothetical protein